MRPDPALPWYHELCFNAGGEIINSMANIAVILKNDEKLKSIVYDEMKHLIDIPGSVPWSRCRGTWSNTDFACLLLYLETSYGIYAPRKCQDALYAVLSNCRRVHPVRDYLCRVSWDRKRRLDRLLIDLLNADDTDYVRAVTRKTLTAAVARIFEPGIKFDYMLVLCGAQGIGKSSLFSRLGGSWYSDSMNIADMRDKSAAEKLQGIWIMELSELAGIRKVDVETVKSFLSRRDDQYRAPYQAYVEPHLRSSIMVGTTNVTDGFLRDITGNRRFWPVEVHSDSSRRVWDLSQEEIDQVWAEAVWYYRQKEPLYLSAPLLEKAELIQRRTLESDPRSGIIEEYLNESVKTRICLMELWCDCLGRSRSDFKRSDAYELENILFQLGNWAVYTGNTSGKQRHGKYGVQKTFVRTV